jgi:hypothetical protein
LTKRDCRVSIVNGSALHAKGYSCQTALMALRQIKKSWRLDFAVAVAATDFPTTDSALHLRM